MIKIFVASIFAICSCCAQGNKDNNPKYKIDKIRATEFLVLKNHSKNITIGASSIKKENTTISLPVKNGKFVILKDTLVEEESPEIIKYNYIGEFKPLNMYIVKAVYIVGNELLLINKTNGNITKMLSFLSATKKFIATYDIPENDEYNGIEVFEEKNNKLIKLFTIKENWFPDEIIWDSNYSFIIKAISLDNNNIYSYLRITLY